MDADARTENESLELPSGTEEDRERRFASGSVEFIGTATVIIRYGGFTILTDPNFLHRGDHVHLGYGMTAPRLTEPAFDIDQLPPVDLVVLSHLHGDHFDQIVEKRLDHGLPIITTPEAARALRRKGFRAARGLQTWQRLVVTKGSGAADHHQHAGAARAQLDAAHAAVGDGDDAGLARSRRDAAGDAPLHHGRHPAARTAARDPAPLPDIDLALLHLGGTRLFGVLLTMDAKQGVECIRWIQPKKAIPIHYDDYPVFKSPLADFAREVDAAGPDRPGDLSGARAETHVQRPARTLGGAGRLTLAAAVTFRCRLQRAVSRDAYGPSSRGVAAWLFGAPRAA